MELLVSVFRSKDTLAKSFETFWGRRGSSKDKCCKVLVKIAASTPQLFCPLFIGHSFAIYLWTYTSLFFLCKSCLMKQTTIKV